MSLTLGDLKGYLLQHHAQDIDVLKRFNTVAQQLNKQSGAILSPSIHRYILEGGSGSTEDDHHSIFASESSEGEEDEGDDLEYYEDNSENDGDSEEEDEDSNRISFQNDLKTIVDRLNLDVCKRYLTLKYLVDNLSLLMKENKKELQSKLKLKKISNEEYEVVNKANVQEQTGKGDGWLFYPDPSDAQNFYLLKKTQPDPTTSMYVNESTFVKLAKRFFNKHKAKQNAAGKTIKGYLKLPLKFQSLVNPSDDIKEFESKARPKMEINVLKDYRMQDNEILAIFK